MLPKAPVHFLPVIVIVFSSPQYMDLCNFWNPIPQLYTHIDGFAAPLHQCSFRVSPAALHTFITFRFPSTQYNESCSCRCVLLPIHRFLFFSVLPHLSIIIDFCSWGSTQICVVGTIPPSQYILDSHKPPYSRNDFVQGTAHGASS